MKKLAIVGLLALSACASDDSVCQSYGAAPGSDNYYQCRMARQAQRSQAVQNFNWTPTVSAPPRQTTCTSRPVGQDINTVCQ